MRNTPMTIEMIKENVPSVFATSPSPKLTDRYTFVPTVEILESFNKEGWDIYSARQMGKGQFSAHELRLRNGRMPQVGDSFLEAIIHNSHNGLLKFSVSAGLHRLVCSNGLTVPTGIASQISVKHMRVDMDSVKKINDEFAQKFPVIEKSVVKLQSTYLNESQVMDFMNKAADIRWEGGTKPPAHIAEEILKPLRKEDAGNSAWQVFNVVQEKFVRGGVKVLGRSGRLTSMREIKNFQKINDINVSLWELAESYC